MMLKVIKKIDWIFWTSILVGLFLLLLVVSPYFGCDDCLNTIIGRYLVFFHKIESGKEFLSSSTSCEVNYGMNGDSFGVVNPFIALLAAVLTFIAFWTQFQANKKMLKDNEKQQIERQFYEMLRIHQGNVEKLHLRVSRQVQFASENAQNIKDEELTDIVGHEVFAILRNEFDYIFKKIFMVISDNKKEAFKIAYSVFFFGKTKKQPGELQEIIDGKNQNFMPPCDVGKGRIYQLDHYYRHLYYMVKTIACSKSYEPREKMIFLKILRAQMTSDEQILLLYNWFAGIDLGGKWENVEHKQYFFSKYQMIHNMFPSNSVFSEREILGMFPHVSNEGKMDMFEHIKPCNLN